MTSLWSAATLIRVGPPPTPTGAPVARWFRPASHARFFSASDALTITGWPRRICPDIAMAFGTSFRSWNSTYANPFDLPVNLSVMSRTSTTVPPSEKNV